LSSYTEDHLVEQPAIQLMQHEPGWDVERGEIFKGGCWILNGGGRRMNKSLQYVHLKNMFTELVNIESL